MTTAELIFAYIVVTLLLAIVAMVAFVAMTMTKAVQARPEIVDVDPVSLKIIAAVSSYSFFFCTALTLASVGGGLGFVIYHLLVLFGQMA